MKRGRKSKYKTVAEKKLAHLAAVKKWALKNRDKIRENYKQKSTDQSAFEQRMLKFESDLKEITLSLEEVLKEQKQLNDLAKWGQK